MAGTGISLAHGLPGLWMVIYAALLSLFYLVDALLLGEAPSLWHRPMQAVRDQLAADFGEAADTHVEDDGQPRTRQ